jgi:hypothetical protein
LALGSWFLVLGSWRLAIGQLRHRQLAKEKRAANFAKEHEAKVKNGIRVFRVHGGPTPMSG